MKAGASVGRRGSHRARPQERRTKTGNKMGILTLSDQTGQFEAIIFSEGLARYRDVLEPGTAVVLMLQAGLEGEEVRARIGMAEPLDEAVAKRQKGMRIFLRDERPDLQRLRTAAGERGEGEVSLVLILDDGDREVEVKLPGKYMATPQIAGALRAVPGGAGRTYELSPQEVRSDFWRRIADANPRRNLEGQQQGLIPYPRASRHSGAQAMHMSNIWVGGAGHPPFHRMARKRLPGRLGRCRLRNRRPDGSDSRTGLALCCIAPSAGIEQSEPSWSRRRGAGWPLSRVSLEAG